MPHVTVSLPILPDDRPLRLTPTDVSQFVRLEQCERFLRFRLAERAGQDFMEPLRRRPAADHARCSRCRATPSRRASRVDSRGRFRSVHYAAKYAQAHNRPENNDEVVGEARSLKPGETVLLFQPRLEAELDGWRLRGDVDLLRLERTGGRHPARPDRRHEVHRRGQGRAPPPGRLLPAHAGADPPGRRHRPRADPDGHPLPPARRPHARGARTRSSRCGRPPSKSSAWTTPCSKSSPTRTPTPSRPTTWCWATDSTARRVAGTPFERPARTACRSSATAASTTSSA